ncbi:MAG: mechanosensitive ion channel family protein [Verrucomicrobiae bacterium]|nr:mechanosensitive ion channel family protein [Verrucomicrobiae bacterium]
MNEIFHNIRVFLESWVGKEHLDSVLRIASLLLIGLPLLWVVSRLLGKLTKSRFGDHLGTFFQKGIYYIGFVGITISVLVEFGFNPAALLGAAGIVSVAVGFASQTSLSNIISGIFLYWERPFTVGDIIKIGDTTGIVLSIDLMSVKLRQFDNHFVRIPNESMIKSQVTNVTRFPIRRVDVEVGVSYGSNVEQVMKVLRNVADQNPFSLDEPNPIVVFKGFGDSSLNFLLGAWCEKTQFLDLRNSLTRDVKNAFDREGIEIPFPQRVVHLRNANADEPVEHSTS